MKLIIGYSSAKLELVKIFYEESVVTTLNTTRTTNTNLQKALKIRTLQ